MMLTILALVALAPIARPARAQTGEAPAAQAAASSATAEQAQHVTAYTLPPELLRKAKNLSRTSFIFDLVSFVWGLFAFWLVLHWRLAARFRNWAEAASRNRFAQAFVFTIPLIVAVSILESPLAIFEHVLTTRYGLSVEGWGALGWDYVKGIGLLMAVGGILAWILYAVIRRSPRRWWFYFWVISLPLLVLMTFVEPFVLEPLFFKFAPLEQKDAALVTALEPVVARSGLAIPASRMYWMEASDKTPLANAYVTGIGASKRIVVWDTTITTETAPEIVAVVGHEMGHYVLGHVCNGLLFSLALMFVLLYLGYRCVGWVLARWGGGWGVRGMGDWASLPALLLILSIFNFASDPITNGFSRHIEHQADVYGLEVTHGILPDAGQVAADSFETEGRAGLSDPDPNPVQVLLFYDHPPIGERIQFCLTYDPWGKGEAPEFVK